MVITPVEFTPDHVFTAANRISDDDHALDLYEFDWQHDVRDALDEHEAPSMSVGDYYDLTNIVGIPIGKWTCESVGWSVSRPSIR